MRYLFILTNLILSLHGYNQITIKGHVRDLITYKGIPSAQISAANLEINPFSTDQNGYFELKLRPSIQLGKSFRLFVKAAGYYGWNEVLPASEIPLENIYLTREKNIKPKRKRKSTKSPKIPRHLDTVSTVVPDTPKQAIPNKQPETVAGKWSVVTEKKFYIGSTIDTKIDIIPGDSIEIIATGFISLSPKYLQVNSTGLKSSDHSLEDRFNIAPQLNYGALIAKVGDGEWLPCGYFRSGTAAHQGRMILAVNDNFLGDNAGAFEVKVITYRKAK